jgi:phosphoribosylaminoimidazolecarboxamide formyltransferase/IMP cyclohydrolase
MLRSSAKNYKYVTVIVDPSDYEPVLKEMEASNGSVSEKTNFRLAIKVFELTSEYDSMIAAYLNKQYKNA